MSDCNHEWSWFMAYGPLSISKGSGYTFSRCKKCSAVLKHELDPAGRFAVGEGVIIPPPATVESLIKGDINE